MLEQEIISMLDSISEFSQYLDKKHKKAFENRINDIKVDVSDLINKYLENSEKELSDIFEKILENNSLNFVQKVKTLTEDQETDKNNLYSENNSLIEIIQNLIPKLTEKGRDKIEDLTIPVELYTNLILIDGKNSIYELFNDYNYEDLFNFIQIFHSIHEEEYISFIKTDKTSSGWVKIGKVLEETNFISENDINKALEYKKLNPEKLIGKALIELKLLEEKILQESLEIQKWLSEAINESIYIDDISVLLKEEDIHDFDVMDFIIPTFTETAKILLSKPSYKQLSVMLNIIDGNSSLLEIYKKNESAFTDKLEFCELIYKLDSNEFLTYKKNNNIRQIKTWVRFGELMVNIGILTKKQVNEAFLFMRKNSKKKPYIGETFIKLGYLTKESLASALKVQNFCNSILTQISYETAFIVAVKEVLENHFKCPTEIGKFTKVSFTQEVENMLCITFTISGKLNGEIFYILDKKFMKNLTKSLIEAFNIQNIDLDESIVLEVFNIITGSSLTKLSKVGMFCETNSPKIEMNQKILIANGKLITVLPLTNEFGRFIIGFDLK